MDAPRRLVVDARGLMQSGIGRYLREVLGGVLRDPRFGRVSVLGRTEELTGWLEEQGSPPQARVVPFPHGFYSPGAQLHWALLAARGALAADASFFPHYDVPLPAASPRAVVTVQDLAHFRLPELFPAWKRALAARVLGRAVRRAGRVLVTSGATRADLLARHPEVAERLAVIPLGVADDFAERPIPPEALARAGALRPYLLCVGNRKPHKNVVAAVETLARLRPRIPGLRLVIAGRDFGDAAAAGERARALGVAGAVVELEPGDGELRALYARAECLLFPSVFEGFGLPVLEAMAFGTPVVASDRASIPEVVGDAGVLVGPHDWDAMAAAVLRLREEPRFREELARRGRERAARLTWRETATRTAGVLWEVAGGRTAAPPREAAIAGG